MRVDFAEAKKKFKINQKIKFVKDGKTIYSGIIKIFDVDIIMETNDNHMISIPRKNWEFLQPIDIMETE